MLLDIANFDGCPKISVLKFLTLGEQNPQDLAHPWRAIWRPDHDSNMGPSA